MNLHIFITGRGTPYGLAECPEMFRPLLDVANGRKKTWAEHWKLHKRLVLFNPAPVT
jgi:galactarate dehydratase